MENKQTKRSIPFVLFALGSGLFLSLSIVNASQKPQASISISASAITVAADSSDIYLRIGGPEGYFQEVRDRDFVEWTPDAGTAHGVYSDDCYVSAGVPRDGSISEKEMKAALEAVSTSSHGSFTIEDSILVEEKTDPVESPDDDKISQQM